MQLTPIREDAPIQKHWELLQATNFGNPWREVLDEFTGDPRQFQERHYSEFVTFLPYVQRFLYGEGKRTHSDVREEAAIRVFRRDDIAEVRMVFPGPDTAPTTFAVAHVDLYFFYDIDVAILVVEIYAHDLPLSQVQNSLFRFGRCYPTYWEPDGHGGHCPKHVEWLSSEGKVLAASDYDHREKYLSFVCRHRSLSLASHWEFLLEPLVLHHSEKPGAIRYRQIEYHLMPVMAYLTLDDPGSLTRAEFARIGLAAAPGRSDTLPFSERYLRDFEERYCYDRYWTGQERTPAGTRFMCTGRVFTMVGEAGEAAFEDRKTNLEQFRHEYFLLFLIPHFHKAALLMLTNRLVEAMNQLDLTKLDSVRQFRRVIRQTLGIFLRFTHRYWSHQISDHGQVKELYRMISEHLGTGRLYDELRSELEDMSQYLDSDALRRQGETMVRLTVVATVGLIGVATTGVLGMNLFALGEEPAMVRVGYFGAVLVPVIAVTLYTVLKSRRLSDFLETLAVEHRSPKEKLAALVAVWKTKHGRDS
ncbi:MAG: hypothetical protein A4E19_03600 [Nitrospira sp. SG-bin1]|nr:MAG: hypothetical protein A4E19_03600 [Nitrospira sp. SG-bin1]